ncbi:MAG: hypothetical protein R3292_03165 [Alcanivorax sp.]|nr:hypothetical protein [Alcanivorax sp.]
MSKIVQLQSRHPQTALDNLNRVTGLDFHQWPESLVNDKPEQSDTNPGMTVSHTSRFPLRVSQRG